MAEKKEVYAQGSKPMQSRKDECSEEMMKRNSNLFGLGILFLIITLGGLIYAIVLFALYEDVTPLTGGIWIFFIIGAIGVLLTIFGNIKNTKCATKQEKKAELD